MITSQEQIFEKVEKLMGNASLPVKRILENFLKRTNKIISCHFLFC